MNEQQFLVGIVRVLNASGRTVGAGFVVSEQLIATCAHVIELAKATTGMVPLAPVSGEQQLTAEVQHWRNSDQEDVAILRLLKPLPPNLRVLPLGTSTHITGHAFSTYGFPDNYPALWGYGKIGGSTTSNGCVLIQLADAREITPGFSGAPVLDQVTHRIVGMVTARTVPERDSNGQLTGRLTETAFITPSQVLQDICPELRIENICPYVGLSAFTEESADLFYGRERLVEKLKENLRRNPRFLAVVGSSGSGKSSVVQAGLFPQLQHNQVPGFQSVQIIKLRLSSPLEQSLMNALFAVFPTMETSGIGDRWSELRQFLQQQQNRILIFIDQFEELFALYPLQEQTDFIADLLRLLKAYSIVTVVITIRSDFYAPLQDSRLGRLLESGQVNVLGMSDNELRTVIIEPATRVGLQLEAGLVDLIVTDLRLKTTRNPLPLLEFTLEQLWNAEHHNNLLTCDRYLNTGRVTGAIAQWADETYHSLNEPEQALTRRIFTRLIHYGSTDIPDTRHRLPLTEFTNTREESTEIRKLINKLADARLLVTEQDSQLQVETVEIIHDALITEWLELGKWIETERVFLLWRQRLSENLKEWKAKGEKEGNLLYEAPLAEAEGYLKERQVDLNADECRYIEAGVRKRDRIKKRRFRLILGIAVGTLIAAIALGIAFFYASVQAVNAQLGVLNFSSDTLLTSNNQLEALLESLRAAKLQKRSIGVFADTRFQVVANLQEAVYSVREYNRLEEHNSAVNSVSFSPDGKMLATASDDETIKLWSNDGKLINTISANDTVASVRFSPDSSTIASLNKNGVVKLWSLEGNLLRTFTDIYSNPSPSNLQDFTELQLNNSSVFGNLNFSPDGQTIASTTQGGLIKLWNQDGTLLTLAGHSSAVNSVTFSPNNQLIASASFDGTVKIWERDGTLLKTLMPESSTFQDRGINFSVSFRPDSKAVVATTGNTITVWDINGERLETIKDISEEEGYSSISRPRVFTSAVFSPDAQIIAAGSWDRTIRLWSHNGFPLETLKGHSAKITEVSFSPDGQSLASASTDSTVKLWKLDNRGPKTLTGHTNSVTQVSFSPNGQTIASASLDNTVKLWRRNGELLTTLMGHGQGIWGDGVQGVSFSPDSQTIVSAGGDSTIRLWNSKGDLLKTINGQPDRFLAEESIPETISVTFSPDAQVIVSGNNRGGVNFWKPDGSLISTFNTRGPVIDIAFSSDGLVLALSTLGISSDSGIILTPEDAESAQYENVILLVTQSGTLNKVLEGHTDVISSVVFSPNGQFLASASLDKTVRIWKRENGSLIKIINGYGGRIRQVKFSPDGEKVAIAGENGIQIWTVSGQLISHFGGTTQVTNEITVGVNVDIDPTTRNLYISEVTENSPAQQAGIQPGDRLLKINDQSTETMTIYEVLELIRGEPGTVITFQLSRGNNESFDISIIRRSIKTSEDVPIDYNSIDFSSDESIIVAGSAFNNVSLWTSTGELIKILEGHDSPVTSVTFSPDGQIIASASLDKTIKLWNINGTLIKTLKGHNNEIRKVSFSPDGQMIASASLDKTVKLWSRDGTLLKTLEEYSALEDFDVQFIPSFYEASFSPDGQKVAAVGHNGTVQIWAKDGSFIKRLQNKPLEETIDSLSDAFTPDGRHFGLSFNPNGQTLVASDLDTTAKLWKTDGLLLKTIQGHNSAINAIKFSPNGQLIVSVSADNTIRLWSQEGDELRTFRGHSDNILSVDFSPDSKIIASASADETVRFWSLEGKELQVLKSRSTIYGLHGHQDRVLSVSFSPDGKLVASAGVGIDKVLILWNFDLDDLMSQGCNHVRNYLKNNSNVSKIDRHLCDSIL